LWWTNASQDGHRVHCASTAVLGAVAVSDDKGRVESTVLSARGLEHVLDVAARGSASPAAAEDLHHNVREQVRRAAVPVDARRVDGEVERAAPALAAQLRLDHPVARVHLLLGLV